MPSYNGDMRSLPDGREALVDLDELGYTPCPICGYEMEREECPDCGGDGEFDWETLQFDDPLWYQPGDTEDCGNCGGKGGWWFCPNANNHPDTEDRDD